MRGGNGYIEEWVNARLVRDAQIGLLWEGTSNINALDVLRRAVAKTRAHKALQALCSTACSRLQACPPSSRAGWRRRSWGRLALPNALRKIRAQRLGLGGASSALYHAASAVLLAWEGTRPGADARRALIARFVLEHRLTPQDPLAAMEAGWEAPAIELLLSDGDVPLVRAAELVAA